MNDNEIWKPVKGICDFSKKRYCKILRCEVSTLGNVRTIFKNGKINILKPQKNSVGYKQVFIQNRWYRIHRLVAEAFLPNPNNLPEVNHKDENNKNNCVENLEWCDRPYNVNYGLRTARQRLSRRKKCPFEKEKKEIYQFTLDCDLVGIYKTVKEASNENNINANGIYIALAKGKTYKNYVWKCI